MTEKPRPFPVECDCGYSGTPQKFRATAAQMLARHKATPTHARRMGARVDDQAHHCPDCTQTFSSGRGLARHHTDTHEHDDGRIWGVPMPGPWVRDALCAQTDPDAFFPGKGESPRDAKAVCATCPVLEQCADFALTHPALTGVWGGTTTRERQLLRKERTTAA